MTRLAMRRSLAVGLVAGLVGAGAAQGDEPTGAGSGPRVRLTAPAVSGKRLIGTLVRQDDATLTLQRQGAKETMAVPRAAITRIEVSRHRSRRGKGAGIGALVGLGAAVVIGVAAGEDCYDGRARLICFDKGTMTAASALLTIPVGTLLGMAVAPGERWQTTTPERLRVALAPVRGGGVRASLSLRF